MSRIYFHTLEGEAEVLGSERFHLDELIGEFTDLKLRELQSAHHARTLAILNPAAAKLSPDLFTDHRSYRQKFTGISGYKSRPSLLMWRDEPFSAWTTKMNTAHRSGDDDLILAAYIYSTCEAFGWVDGPDREWFAEKIDHALCSGAFRTGQGWTEVIELLTSTDKGEMVMSYSVTGGFPALSFVCPEIDWDDMTAYKRAENAWEGLGSDGQWAAGMTRLRNDGTVQIGPAVWGRQYAGANVAVQDLMCDDWVERLDAAMNEERGAVDPWK